MSKKLITPADAKLIAYGVARGIGHYWAPNPEDLKKVLKLVDRNLLIRLGGDSELMVSVSEETIARFKQIQKDQAEIEMGPLKKADIISGHTYRAKRPRMITFASDWDDKDDRQVVWCGPMSLQYDSSTVRHGRHYPRISIEAFRRWAGEDVTEFYKKKDAAEKAAKAAP